VEALRRHTAAQTFHAGSYMMPTGGALAVGWEAMSRAMRVREEGRVRGLAMRANPLDSTAAVTVAGSPVETPPLDLSGDLRAAGDGGHLPPGYAPAELPALPPCLEALAPRVSAKVIVRALVLQHWVLQTQSAHGFIDVSDPHGRVYTDGTYPPVRPRSIVVRFAPAEVPSFQRCLPHCCLAMAGYSPTNLAHVSVACAAKAAAIAIEVPAVAAVLLLICKSLSL
jgi:hypothetical protein